MLKDCTMATCVHTKSPPGRHNSRFHTTSKRGNGYVIIKTWQHFIGFCSAAEKFLLYLKHTRLRKLRCCVKYIVNYIVDCSKERERGSLLSCHEHGFLRNLPERSNYVIIYLFILPSSQGANFCCSPLTSTSCLIR